MACSNYVRVVSYNVNVLSSSLSSETHFIKCQADAVEPKLRLIRLKDKLEEEIAKHSIICLQEVSREWSSVLHSYSSQQNYYYISSQYCHEFTGYMGVGIAYPTQNYELQDCLIKRVSEGKIWPSLGQLTQLDFLFIQKNVNCAKTFHKIRQLNLSVADEAFELLISLLKLFLSFFYQSSWNKLLIQQSKINKRFLTFPITS